MNYSRTLKIVEKSLTAAGIIMVGKALFFASMIAMNLFISYGISRLKMEMPASVPQSVFGIANMSFLAHIVEALLLFVALRALRKAVGLLSDDSLRGRIKEELRRAAFALSLVFALGIVNFAFVQWAIVSGGLSNPQTALAQLDASSAFFGNVSGMVGALIGLIVPGFNPAGALILSLLILLIAKFFDEKVLLTNKIDDLEKETELTI